MLLQSLIFLTRDSNRPPRRAFFPLATSTTLLCAMLKETALPAVIIVDEIQKVLHFLPSAGIQRKVICKEQMVNRECAFSPTEHFVSFCDNPSTKIRNNSGESVQPCFNPSSTENHSVSSSPRITVLSTTS